MKAWIEGKKRTGPWKVRWREQVDGAWVKKTSRGFGNLPDAEAELQAVNLRLDKIASLQPRRSTALMPIAKVIERWKADSLKSGTVRSYYADEVERVVTALCKAQGWEHTNHITASAVETWRASKVRGHTKPTAMLKSLMRWARSVLKQPIDDDLLHLAVMKPQSRPSPPLLSDDQVAAIVERAYTFGESVGAAIEHLSLFGCRPVDVCRLNVADWNRTTRTLTLQTTKSRTRPSHPIAGPFADFAKRLDRLSAGRRPDAPLYLSPKGDRWEVDRNGTSRELADWYWWHLTNKLPAITHEQRGIQCLKDYAITALDSAGVDDATKKLFTGHRTASVYERYKTTNQDRAAAALEKLGAKRAPSGGKVGGTSNLRGQNEGQTPSPRQTKKQRNDGKNRENKRA
jgi:integrase